MTTLEVDISYVEWIRILGERDFLEVRIMISLTEKVEHCALWLNGDGKKGRRYRRWCLT